MPLTAKGKKLKKKFREQYGKKKGDSVFYAMENSGKLKKVIKARGGDAAKSDQAAGRDAGRAAESGVDRSAVSATSEYRKNILRDQRQKAIAAISPSTTLQNKAIAIGLGLAVPGLGYAYKKGIDQTAMGYGKPKIKPPKVGGGGGDGQQRIVKPKIQPIQATKPIDKNLIKPKDNFFNFVSYRVGGLSGGVKYGPPPKRGPNPQVPPIKMKKGGYN
tara:strand:- start:176 stop:826 length:651 start_codon:yes stop_codon:yes gene_type:complete